MASDYLEPTFVAMAERLEHMQWNRPLSDNERLQMFQRVDWSSVRRAQGAEEPADEEIDARALFLSYRLVRWILQGLGWAGPADPMSFITETQAHRKGAPFGGRGMWGKPVPRQALVQASSTMPGVYDLLSELERAKSPGLFLQPPPLDAPETDRIAFAYSLVTGIDALRMDQQTADKQHLGLARIDIRRLLPPREFFTDEAYAELYHNFPGPQQLLDFEQSFMTALAEALVEANEDRVRMWIRSTWQMVDFEAFSLAQTAKAWGAAMRPIDMEVERRMALRRLEGSHARAQLVGDHRGEVMAQVQISRILGLVSQSPVDLNDAAAASAIEAHEGDSEQLEQLPASPQSDSVDSAPSSLEEWRLAQGKEPPRSTGFDVLEATPSTLDPNPNRPRAPK